VALYPAGGLANVERRGLVCKTPTGEGDPSALADLGAPRPEVPTGLGFGVWGLELRV